VNVLRLRLLLERIFATSNQIDDFEVEHTFERIGRKTMLLNALAKSTTMTSK